MTMAVPRSTDLRRGFVALLPLWPSTAAIGLAYALVSRAAGLSGVETQLLSLTVFAGAAQFAFVDLHADEASVLAIVGTILLLNARHILYGLAINRWLTRPAGAPRPLISFFVVDESYGIAEREAQTGPTGGRYLVGAGLSLYVAWNVSTFAGLVAGSLVDIPDEAGLDFVFPLSFVAITLPLIRSRSHVAAVALAALTTVLVSRVANSGLTVLTASVVAVGLGAMVERTRD
jgi:4-azaleucine resistance transporter AzlC